MSNHVHNDNGLEPLEDDRLALLFACCDPDLTERARLVLALRLVAGLKTQELARALLISRGAVEQHLAEAHDVIGPMMTAHGMPRGGDVLDRLPQVLRVIYLVFNEGYTTTAGSQLLHADLCFEAIRLAQLLSQFVPHEPEAWGLLALPLMIDGDDSPERGATAR
jgi:RNA polymerase sigma-70 factor, ECF subfamily